MRPLVLCHHGVSADWEHAMSVSLEAIERQLTWLLRRGFAPAAIEQAVLGRGKLLHVTFDDGLSSVGRAVPALERLGVPISVFVCAELADGGRSLDVPEFRGELEAHTKELETMSWEVLRELSERGVAVGSHSLTHAHLARLTDAEVDHELKMSRERIQDELGRPCRYVAYPYGESNRRIRAAAQRAGYEAGLGLPGDPTWGDGFNLPRVGLWRKDGPIRVALKTGRIARAPMMARLRGKTD